MTTDDISALEDLLARASAGPWYVRQLDDDMCMGALTISTKPQHSEHLAMRFGNWPSEEIVAATLIQSPPYVSPKDNRWNENAELIAALRNAASELLRLARMGLEAESSTSA